MKAVEEQLDLLALSAKIWRLIEVHILDRYVVGSSTASQVDPTKIYSHEIAIVLAEADRNVIEQQATPAQGYTS